jgi:carboxyl-terminal processing protease
MRRNFVAAGRRFFFAALAYWTLVAAVLAQSAVTIALPKAPDLGEVLRRGQQMESEKRWGEALSHYEDALRQFPGEENLKRRFDFARLHYDLARRYHDRSYRDLLQRTTPAEALSLYHEVLLKIQAHYVDAPRWRDTVEAGTAGFEVALGETAFLQANAPAWIGRPLDGFCRELRVVLSGRVIQSRTDARDAVAQAATLAQRRLGLSPVAVVLEYVCAAASSLDAYSAYLTPDQLAEVYSQIRGNFVGLGIELKAVDGSLTIVRVIPHSPAQEAGLREGDRIVSVDGQSTATVTTDGAANLLQGPEGSSVVLGVKAPDGQVRQTLARRRRVEVPSVDEVKMLPGAQGVGYLKLTCFQETTARDLDAALWELYRAGMRSLVIDVRGNPGGLLRSGVEAADLFIEHGVIVSTHGRNAHEDAAYAAHEAGTWRVPLVVLIDHESASAAEIFAGAIREHGRGTVVGKRSYGKGSVQGIFALSQGAAGLRLTTAKFYSPTGRPYSGVGVEPHVVVHQVARPLEPGRPAVSPADDPFLLAAVQVLQQSMASR